MQEMWQIREMITLGMLGVCAYTDIKERNVYILPLAVSGSGSLAVMLTAYFFIPECQKLSLLSDGILGPAIVLLFMIIVSRIKQDHVGAGDGLMIAACALTVGMKKSLFVSFVAFLSAAVFAVFFVLFGKKRRGIPFAPFVLTGFAVMLIYEI